MIMNDEMEEIDDKVIAFLLEGYLSRGMILY